MTVAIVGSRDYAHPEEVRNVVRRFHAIYKGRLSIVSGGARGVDAVAADEARRLGISVEEYPADWSQGRGAGLARNAQIVAAADRVTAFHDGTSRGTLDTIRRAVAAGKPCWVYGPDGTAHEGARYLAEREPP